LLDVPTLFAGIDDIAIVELDDTDVVRHPLVAKIVRAYARVK
jgi:phosphate starvation-inducible protein PhoH